MSRRAMMVKPPSAGGGGASDPSAIFGTDLVAWYKRATGIYDAKVGGSLVSTDLTEIGRWEDQSGNGFHMVRHDATTFGHIQWRDAAHISNLGSGVVWFSSGTGFDVPNGVGSALNSAGRGAIFVSWKSLGVSGQWVMGAGGCLYPWSDGHIYEGWGQTTRPDCGSPIVDIATDFRRYAVLSAPSDFRVFLNNASQYSSGTNTVNFLTSGNQFGTDLSFALVAYVSDIVIVKVTPTSTQLSQVDTYLST